MKRHVIAGLWVVLSLAGCGNPDVRNAESGKLYLLALDEYAKGNTLRAREVCEEILRKHKDFYQASLLMGKIDFFEKAGDRGEDVFKKLLTNHPEYMDARIWYIRSLISKNSLGEAIREIEVALTLNAEDWRLYHLYAIACEGLQQLDGRLEMLEKARLQGEEASVALLDQARLWYSLGKTESALESLEVAAALGKRSPYISEGVAGLRALVMEEQK